MAFEGLLVHIDFRRESFLAAYFSNCETRNNNSSNLFKTISWNVVSECDEFSSVEFGGSTDILLAMDCVLEDAPRDAVGEYRALLIFLELFLALCVFSIFTWIGFASRTSIYLKTLYVYIAQDNSCFSVKKERE